jgi:putative ATPase
MSTPEKKKPAPLPDRLRPQTLDEFVGQEKLVGPDGPIRKAIDSGEIPSMIFWGPPGSGKTTLARIIANVKGYRFFGFSAVLSGVNVVRGVIKEAGFYRAQGKRTILFVDEIHRFNKAQQDAFLSPVEDGTITLIGATTENPSFEVISALLSRSSTYVFEPLGEQHIVEIIDRAVRDENGLLEYGPRIKKPVKEYLARIANGDARVALGILEFVTLTASTSNGTRNITTEAIKEAVQHSPLLYDKKGEEHYNLISALIKSMRASEPDASLYWLARMLESGEDPLFIVRRLVIFAAEDIGNASPHALVLATACKSAIEFVGRPEGFLPLSQTVAYLATAPKSNTSLTSYKRAMGDVKKHGALPVPLYLRNPVTSLMQEIGYGEGYEYPHDHEGRPSTYSCLPEKIGKSRYYSPSDSGFESEIRERMKRRDKSM